MNDDPAWFAPKRYGYGAGLPISWQGWALTLGYIAICIGACLLSVRKPMVLAAVLIPFTVIFITITARTTKGGWRWRWGEEE